MVLTRLAYIVREGSKEGLFSFSVVFSCLPHSMNNYLSCFIHLN